MSILQLIAILASISSAYGLYCSVCGKAGQPSCTPSSPLPTLCSNGSLFCLNSTVSMTGYPTNILRSCVSTVPIDYQMNSCLVSNTSTIVVGKCVCGWNGCNFDVSKTNLTLAQLSAQWNNQTSVQQNNSLVCSQCGYPGQPSCTTFGPQPTVCSSGSLYCLNNTLIMNGLTINTFRSCANTIPSGYLANYCQWANSSTVVGIKCACSTSGCNANVPPSNLSTTPFPLTTMGLTNMSMYMPNVYFCSQCGYPGQPVCTAMGPQPTICPVGTFYCLNNSLTVSGTPLSTYRSCAAVLPAGYISNVCAKANGSSIVASKCACSHDGCNLNWAAVNFTGMHIPMTWGNFSFNASNMIPLMGNFSMGMPGFNLSGIHMDLSNWSDPMPLVNQMLGGNNSLADDLSTLLSTTNFTILQNSLQAYLPMLNSIMSLNQASLMDLFGMLMGMTPPEMVNISASLNCSQCGGSGQPVCTKSGPKPTLCPSGTTFCLNNSLSISGQPISAVRSCAAVLPSTYVANVCLMSNASVLLAAKCSCSTNGCNVVPTTPELSLSAMLQNWGFPNNTAMDSFGLNKTSMLQPANVWQNVSSQMRNVNFTQVMSDFTKLNQTVQMQLISNLISGNSSDQLLAGQPVAKLLNNTAGFLPFMLASVVNNTNITEVLADSIVEAYVAGVDANSTDLHMTMLQSWMSLVDQLATVTQTTPVSATTETVKKSGCQMVYANWLITFIVSACLFVFFCT